MVRPIKQITSKGRPFPEHVSKRSPPPDDSQGSGVSANLWNVELMNGRFAPIGDIIRLLELKAAAD
jgi:hypothetical protein